jgi:hypothetical protein
MTHFNQRRAGSTRREQVLGFVTSADTPVILHGAPADEKNSIKRW